jgi:hypothetical protein
MAFSPDGQLLASAGSDGAISVWRVADGKQLREMGRQFCQILCLAFSPDGKLLAAGQRRLGEDVFNGMRLWDVASGQENGGVRKFDLPVSCLSFSPDGKVLAAGSAGGRGFLTVQNVRLALLNLPEGKQIRQLKDPEAEKQGLSFFDDILALGFSPDGKRLFSAGVEWNLREWNPSTGALIRSRDLDPEVTRDLAVSPNGWMIGASRGAKVCLWDTITLGERGRLVGHADVVGPVAFSPNGRILASGSHDSTVILWNVLALPTPDRSESVSADDVEKLWNNLGDRDSTKVFGALKQLVACRQRAVSAIEKHLAPVRAADPRVLAGLITDLGNNSFAIRNRAAKSLESMRELAEPYLQKTCAGRISAEERARIEQILKKLKDSEPPPEELRKLRALEIIEYIGARDSERLLEMCANGAPESRFTQASKATLQRLRKLSGSGMKKRNG